MRPPMRLPILSFCIASLAGVVIVCAVLFPYASMSHAEAEAARTPVPMEEFDLVDLGDDYGELPVVELIGYYLENPPPVAAATGAAPKKKHFGGC